MRNHRLTVLALGMLFVAAAAAAANEAKTPEERALRRAPVRHTDFSVVLAWNRIGTDIAYAEDQFQTFKGVRALAMMHLAIHDALNAVAPIYEAYAHSESDPAAHPAAAAAQAAHDVLSSQYPDRRADLDAELQRWNSRMPDGSAKTRGLNLGRRAAAAILSIRADDGSSVQGTFEFRKAMGAYQTTPSWNGFVLQPGFRHAKPFGLRSAEQFRPIPPPALESAEYAAAYREVKESGSRESAVRTPDQTGYAVWWMEFSDGAMNRLARDLVSRRQIHLWRAARLFAWLNMSIFDSYLATWDAKFEYNHWRPYTAIREAGGDGNPDTDLDAAWEPLRPAPPFPEYVSAHGAGCNASAEILQWTFGGQVSFTARSLTAPPDMPTRSFRSFRQAGAECADSRVRLGFHFRYATDAGMNLGRHVAGYVADHTLRLRGSTRR